jgi:hypothetical protein
MTFIVTDTSARLESGSGTAGLQHGDSANGAFVESVAVIRVSPCSSTGGNTGDNGSWGGSDRVEKHEGHEGANCFVGELHDVGYRRISQIAGNSSQELTHLGRIELSKEGKE